MNVRAAVITLLALPLSLVAAVIAMDRFGLTINSMSLGGLAIAIGERSTTPSSTLRTSSGGCERTPPGLNLSACRCLRSSIVPARRSGTPSCSPP